MGNSGSIMAACISIHIRTQRVRLITVGPQWHPTFKSKPMKTLLLFLFAVFVSAPAISKTNDEKCSQEIYDSVGRYLGMDNFLPSGIVVSEACKTWPFKTGFLLAGFAYDTGVEYEKSLVVAILDKKTLRVIASFQGVISEDAVTEAGQSSLKLDTAKYQLTGDIRAFGLRFTSSARGPSCADGASWDELTLFVQEKKKLRPVFRKDMQFQEALRGCIGSATGHDVWEYGKRVVSVADTQSNGFFDLLITETITVDGNVEQMPKDIDTKKRTRSYLMKYDGKEYR